MDNEELARQIKERIGDATGEIRRDIGRIEGLLEAHRSDAFAHQQVAARYEAETRDWRIWRSNVNMRLAAIGGGLAVLVFVITVFGSLLFNHIGFH